MPLTSKGKKILRAMEKTYKNKGGLRKAKQVFYASRNAGKIKGVDPESMSSYSKSSSRRPIHGE